MTSTPTQTLKRMARTGLIVLALGSATLAAAPAQAAGNSNAQFSFSLNFGNGGQFSITNHRRQPQRYCAPLPHVRQAFQQHGFHDIAFGHQNGPWVVVHAKKAGWQYTYRVNRCTWQVILVESRRIHRRGWNPPSWPHHNNGPNWGGNNGSHWGGNNGSHWGGYNN